jgi:aspartate/methionine/tyrosine aminotransferase
MLGHVPYLRWIREAFTRTRISLASSGAMPPDPGLLTGLVDDPAGWVMPAPGEATRRLEAAVAARWGVPEAAVVGAAGTTGANFLCMASLLTPGDEVVLEWPTYLPLEATARALGAHVRLLPRKPEDDWQPDPEAVVRLLSPRTRLVILSCPHNPTGAVLAPERLSAILEAVEARGRAFVLLDAVYRELLPFEEGRAPYPVGGDRSLLVTASLTKAYGLPDLRAGWVIAPPALRARLLGATDHFLPGAPAPGWLLAAAILEGEAGAAIRAGVRSHLDEAGARLVAFLDRMEAAPAFRPPVPFIVFPRLPAGAGGGERLAARLLDASGVLIVPGRHFGDDEHVRLAAFAPTADLDAGLARLETLLRAAPA